MTETGGLHILAVDDDEDLRTLIRLQLRPIGEVITCPDVYQALATVEHEEVDIILLDLILPGAGGLDLLQRLRVSWPHIPVVLLTGMPSPSMLERAFALGATDIVRKPFRADELVDAILAATRPKTAVAAAG